MHLALGRKTAYSIEALMYLAGRDAEGPCKAREIGEAVDVPPRYLPQILAGLVHAQLLTSEAGRGGGYSLARPAEGITLLDVIRAASGELVDEHCQLTGEEARPGYSCPVHDTWVEVRRTLSTELMSTTLADLISARPADADTPGASTRR